MEDEELDVSAVAELVAGSLSLDQFTDALEALDAAVSNNARAIAEILEAVRSLQESTEEQVSDALRGNNWTRRLGALSVIANRDQPEEGDPNPPSEIHPPRQQPKSGSALQSIGRQQGH